MPLDPKQQPPYYTPGTTPTPPTSGDFTRLNTQFTNVTTSSTTETPLYTYTIPANTLSQNGDTLKIYYTAIQTDSPVTHRHRPYFNSNQFATIEDTSSNEIIIAITIIRTSTTTARITIEVTGGTYAVPIIQTENSIDYTTTIPFEITGQCPTTGTIQTYSMTIDKISI